VPCDATAILKLLSGAALKAGDRDSLAEGLVAALQETYPQASWVGIYWLEGNELRLGPYIGPPTEHTSIPVGTGICGTAIAEDADQVVADVRERSNYLACSPTVRSEVVVLIRSRGQVVGQIDMDSDEVGGFSGDDACVLKAVADSFGGLLAALTPSSRDD
jgi:L-methionine (R)-S-oxide reductase